MNRIQLRLQKLAEAITYTATSPIRITIANESDNWEGNIGNDKNFKELRQAVKEDMQKLGPGGLADYFNGDDAALSEVIDSIIVGVTMKGQSVEAATTIKCNRELTSDEIEKLKDYLTGQYSDGWGEGFEQHPFAEWEEDVEYEGEDEEDEDGGFSQGEPYYNQEDHEMCAHFWNHKNFSITIK